MAPPPSRTETNHWENAKIGVGIHRSLFRLSTGWFCGQHVLYRWLRSAFIFFSLGVQVFAATRWRHCTFFYELINGIGGHWSPCCFPWSWSFAWSLRGLRNRIVRAESNGRIVLSEGLMCRRISGLGRCLWWTWRQVPFIGAEALWSQVGGFWQQLTVCIIRRRIS